MSINKQKNSRNKMLSLLTLFQLLISLYQVIKTIKKGK
jgi:hypothetical protein